MKTVAVTAADQGTVNVTLPKLRGGLYFVKAEFVPADTTTTNGSKSDYRFLLILF